MKIIDNKGRIFGKVSIIDIIVVLAIVLFIVSLIVSWIDKKNKAAEVPVVKQEVSFVSQFKLSGLYNTEGSPFCEGDNIYSSDNDLIGKIVKVEKKAMPIRHKLYDGRYVDRESATNVDYFITVEGKGELKDKGIFAAEKVAIIPQNNVNIKTKFYSGYAVVLDVSKQ